jgi:hypothetical protein
MVEPHAPTVDPGPVIWRSFGGLCAFRASDETRIAPGFVEVLVVSERVFV